MEFKNAIALTGGIATGKSSVCSILKLYGYHIIDADKIAHDVLHDHKDNIAQMFGDQFIIDDEVDRKKLGDLIFNNKYQRKKLENLLHPIIRQTIQQLAKEREKFQVPYILEIPLFFDKRGYNWIKRNILVYTPKEIQLQRLLNRAKISHEKAKNIIKSQMDIEEKRKLADFVIDNSKDLKHLQNEVERAINEYIKI